MLSFKEFLEAKGWWEDPEHVWFDDPNMTKFLDGDGLRQRQRALQNHAYQQAQKSYDDAKARGEPDEPEDPDSTRLWKPTPPPGSGDTTQVGNTTDQRIAAIEKKLKDLEQSSDIVWLKRKIQELETAFSQAQSSIGQAVGQFRNVSGPAAAA